MNQAFKVLVFLAFGYLLFNVPLFQEIANFFWWLIQYVGKAVLLIFKAALENKPENRESLIFYAFVFLLLVGIFRMRK
jgi:hypothetical protein